MKRIISIFFCFLYLIPSVGLSLNFHYCGKKLTSVSMVGASGCCCSKKKPMNGCCKDKSITFEVKETLINTTSKRSLHADAFKTLNLKPHHFQLWDQLLISSDCPDLFTKKGIPKDPLYVRNQVFRI